MNLVDELTSRRIPKEMSFSNEEYERRLRKVREWMAACGLDALVLTSTSNKYSCIKRDSACPAAGDQGIGGN